MSDKYKDLEGLDRLRGTEAYNVALTQILFGDLVRAGLILNPAMEKSYDAVTTIDGFRGFCKQYGIDKKIDIEKAITDAEAYYIQDEKNPPTEEETDEATDEFLIKIGALPEEREKIRKKRELKKRKPQ